MPSFDAVSELDTHELTNAVDQANRELSQRFDFKDTGASLRAQGEGNHREPEGAGGIPAQADGRHPLAAAGKRGIDVRCMEKKDPVTNLAEARQDIVLRHGIDPDTGKKLQKLVKESKLKVQASIQGDKLRVTGKQRDDLQAAMALLRKAEVDRPLQFNNFRD